MTKSSGGGSKKRITGPPGSKQSDVWNKMAQSGTFVSANKHYVQINSKGVTKAGDRGQLGGRSKVGAVNLPVPRLNAVEKENQ